LLRGLNGTKCYNVECDESIKCLKQRIYDLEGIEPEHQRLTSGIRNLKDEDKLDGNFTTININLRLLGGKGGFGALLRGAGTKAGQKKNTNFDDCRDLNGRRMKDVKAEKELLDWFIAQKREKREKELAKKVEASTSKSKREEPIARFEDPEYIAQLREVEDSISNSLEQGLKASKQKMNNEESEKTKKPKKRKSSVLWSGIESDSEDDQEMKDPKGKEEEESISEKTEHKEEVSINEELDIVEKEKETINENPIIEINLEEFKSAIELESLGLEKLREQLQIRGLKVGGSMKDRASRLFSIKGKSKEEIDPKLFANQSINNKKKSKNSSN